MNQSSLPVLYTFRRCPYAMRARMAIHYSQIPVEQREIVLKHKPKSMLQASAKGTVPVLVLTDGTVIDESRDIMGWALAQNDPDSWYTEDKETLISSLIDMNDEKFKPYLDKYKYSVRYPDYPSEVYRSKAEVYLQKLDNLLSESKYLVSDSVSLADIAIFPFIRQFAFVDKQWFDQTAYDNLKQWLNEFINSPEFIEIMLKHEPWQE